MENENRGQIIEFKSLGEKQKEELGIRVLNITRDFAVKIDDFGEYLGVGTFPTFLDDEILELELLAMELLGIPHEDEVVFDLYQEFILGEISASEFVKAAKGSVKMRKGKN